MQRPEQNELTSAVLASLGSFLFRFDTAVISGTTGFFLWMAAAGALGAAPIETKKPDGTPTGGLDGSRNLRHDDALSHHPKGSTPQERTADLNRIVDNSTWLVT